LVPGGPEVVSLQVRQVDRTLHQYLPIRPELLIVVASSWPGFLEIARAVLTAAGCDPDALIFRDSREESWKRGLRAGSVVLCDVLTSERVPNDVHKIVFALVSDTSIAELGTYERFFGEKDTFRKCL
jgi:hypothetical protein